MRYCANAEDFIGGVDLNQISRYRLYPRDARTDADYYEVIET